MTAQISVPPKLPLAELAANLHRIAGELGVDIEVSAYLSSTAKLAGSKC